MNLATIGGNIGRASPADDVLLALSTLNADVKLVSKKGSRIVNITKLVVGPSKLSKEPNEIIAEILLKPTNVGDCYFFKKLGERKAHYMAIVNMAGILRPKGESSKEFSYAKIFLGAVAPTLVEAVRNEKLITESPLNAEKIKGISEAVTEDISPISNVRGAAEYRRKVASALMYEVLSEIPNDLCKKVTY